ncbi:uncharacterized protein LOC134684685 [Mytilus trossulus]|uniref:uncharacterized protein LOC134684685 n=1 Tax=Mytilus trossulus TaxID=6551 RepID=UPI003005000A
MIPVYTIITDMNASLIVGVILMLTKFGHVVSVTWYKSQLTGTNNANDIKWSVKVRSVTECCYQCTFNSNCRSFQYENGAGYCTLLFASRPTGPFVNSSGIVHYRDYLVCPHGYDSLPTSNACVALHTDYRTWNDSLIACKKEGANLPILDTDTLFYEFVDYMDNKAVAANRVAVHGTVINGIGHWSNGDTIDILKFCVSQPDQLKIQDVCLYMAHVDESWCGSPVNRLDDATCDHQSLRIFCPKGYYLLSVSNACVVLYPDYMPWHDSLIACQSEGADFPILDTDTLFNEFLDYIDNQVVSPDSVAVNGRLINNIGYWGNGDVIDVSRFCAFQPDEIGNPDICLFIAHSNETWCGSPVNRLDDSKCVYDTLRMCMIKL